MAMAFLWAKLASIAAPNVPDDSTDALQMTGKHLPKNHTMQIHFPAMLSPVPPITETDVHFTMYIPVGVFHN